MPIYPHSQISRLINYKLITAIDYTFELQAQINQSWSPLPEWKIERLVYGHHRLYYLIQAFYTRINIYELNPLQKRVINVLTQKLDSLKISIIHLAGGDVYEIPHGCGIVYYNCS